MSDVFLSYAREDLSHAERLARALEAAGWSVWWDRSIPAGKTFDEVIEAKLEAARCVVVLWSRAAVASDWVREEASEGKRRGILVPVLIESEVKVPLGFRRIQAADLADWDGSDTDSSFQQLVRDIGSVRTGESRPVLRIVPAPPGARLLFLVEALVIEDDTHLVLGADPVARETHEEPGGLLEAARASIQPVPGMLVVRGERPVRIHAIVHDLDEQPSWREEWVASALGEIIREVGTRELRSISLPILGGVHGSLAADRFAELLRDALAEASVECLDEVWLTVRPDVAAELARRLRALGFEVQERAEE
ncbi:MAG: toll/interleukin-1 receptor domain-containing protein [Gemmatimonadales bacterium]|jgi:hypothetical protein